MSLYDDMGVPEDATPEEIKAAYRDLAKEHHPDKQGDSNKMAVINKAYSILINPEKRKRYDETGQDNAEQPFQQRFLAFCNTNWLKVIQNAKNIDHDDLIEEFVDQCHAIIEQLQRNHSQYQAQQKILEKVLKRLKKKGKDNTLVFIVEDQIAQARNSAAAMDEEVRFMDQVIEVLETYGYDAEPAPANIIQPYTITL